MRRFLAWLFSLCLLVSLLCGAVFGAEIPNIENMGIDPWADFEMISQSMGGSQLASASLDDDYVISDDVGLMSVSDDVGIMPMSDVTNPQWYVRVQGFASSGVDEDGSEWSGVPVYDGLYIPVNSVPLTGDLPISSPSSCWVFGGTRPAPVNSFVPASQSSWWTGRPAIISGDPDITIRSSYNWNGGSVYYDVRDWEEVEASSLQVMDARFLFDFGYVYFDDKDDAGRLIPFYSSYVSGGNLTEVHLIINGKDVGAIQAEITGRQAGQYRYFSVYIPDTLINFDSQLVRSVSFRFDISSASLNGMPHYSGGVGVSIYAPPISGKNPYPVVSDSVRLYTGADPNVENTGLLKSIINFLKSIVDGITQLPGKIATAIIEGIKSLFIPDEDFITQWKEDFFSMLETKFGFIYQCFQMLGDFFDEFVLQWGSATDYVFKFPTVEFTVQGTTYTVIQEQEVSFDNPAMDIIRPFLGTFVSIIMVLGFVHSMEEMFVAIISGWSYFSYLKRDGDTTREEEENS